MDALNEKVTLSNPILDKAGNFISNISGIIYGVRDEDKSSNYLGGSISQYSKNLVMTFPVLCDNSLSPETASMISKANERNITTMLQLLFTAMNIEANDGMKVIAKVHKNISAGMDVAEVADKMEQIGTRSVMFGLTDGGKDIFAGESAKLITDMMDELKYKKYNTSFPVNSLNEQSLGRFNITKSYNKIVINEAGLSPSQKEDIINKIAGIISDENDNAIGPMSNEEYYKYINSPEFSSKIDTIISTLGMNVNITDKQRAEIEKEVKDIIRNTSADKLNRSNMDLNKLKSFELMRNNYARLIDTEVKKANELQPTVIQVNYSQKNDSGEFELRSFLAGIKSRLIPVSSTDIVERLIAKNKTKINFLNFIRATTGEIKFFKDFLFAIDQAKLDSKNAVKKGEAAAIWNCLANRAVKNTNSKLKKLGNDASAITVLVVSQETVNYMKNVHKFDLEKMANTKMICDSYNLMGIMIADESIEVLKSYYVGNNGYEQIAYSFLEKEAKNSDYKKMINLFGKMNVR